MINSLKELQQLLKICRKSGVSEIELGDVKIKLGELPPEQHQHKDASMDQDEIQDPYANFPGGMLSPSQLAFYSAGGVPEDDPEITGTQQ